MSEGRLDPPHVATSGSATAPETTATAPAKALPERYELLLPSGATASILREYKVKHLRLAMRLAADDLQKDPQAVVFGLICVRARIRRVGDTEFRDLMYEDVDDLNGDDGTVLLGACGGGNGSSAAPTSPP